MLQNILETSNKQNSLEFGNQDCYQNWQNQIEITRYSNSNEKTVHSKNFAQIRKTISKKCASNSINTEISNYYDSTETPKHHKTKFNKLQDIVRHVTVENQNQNLREIRQSKNNKYRDSATSQVIFKFSEVVKKLNNNLAQKEKESKQVIQKKKIEIIKQKISQEFSTAKTLENHLVRSFSLKQLEIAVDSLSAKIQFAKIQLSRKNKRNQKIEGSRISQRTNQTIKKSEFSVAKSNLNNKAQQAKQKNHNIYYVSEIIRAMNQKNSLTMHHLNDSLQIIKQFHKQSIKYPEFSLNLQQKSFYQNKKTIVFQLNSLIYINDKFSPHDYDAKILIDNNKSDKPFYIHFKLRPYVMIMLKKLALKFEIIIFTTEQQKIANKIIDFIDPTHQLIQHRLFNQYCIKYQNRFIKDLRIINRALSQIVLVDTDPSAYVYQLQNGIPILPYYNNIQDNCLKQLTQYLQNVQRLQDVRETNKKYFKLDRYKQFNNIHELITQLYLKQQQLMK